MEPQQAAKWRSCHNERNLMKRMSTTWKGIICLGVLLMVTGCFQLPVSGLQPEYPKDRGLYQSSKVDSLQPTFRWEPFPRPQDYEADNERVLMRIRNVAYDLKIWRVEDDYPVELIYARQGLPEPFHKIEEPLEPSTKYFWRIRARFELDGRPRVTGWPLGFNPSQYNLPNPVPHPFYYGFKTPRK